MGGGKHTCIGAKGIRHAAAAPMPITTPLAPSPDLAERGVALSWYMNAADPTAAQPIVRAPIWSAPSPAIDSRLVNV